MEEERENTENKVEQEQSVSYTQGEFGNYIEDAKEEFNNTENKVQQFVIENLLFVKENMGCILGDHADINDISLGGNQKRDNQCWETFTSDKCVVEDRETLVSWLTQHYNDFEMAFIIALAVFEKTPYLWVYEMAEELFSLMEGDKEEARQNKIRIPNNQRIKTVGGRKYLDGIYNHTGRIENEFICFQKPEYATRVLECMWNEFIFFREILVRWLISYISNQNYSKTIRAVNALAELATLDFDYFNKNVIKALWDRNEFMADFAISQVVVQVHKDGRYRDNAEKLFKYWARGGNLNYSLTALMICVNAGWDQEKVQLAVEGYIVHLLLDMKANRRDKYRRMLPVFYEIGSRKAVYFKAIVCNLYDKLMECAQKKQRSEKVLIGLIFFLLLQIDDSESNIDINQKEKNRDMIFVKMCLIKNDVAHKVQELWRYLWKSREFHKLTKEFLEKYLYQYGGCKQSDIDYLRQFLYSFQDSEEDRNNMEFFLKKISFKNKRPVRTAERINHIG